MKSFWTQQKRLNVERCFGLVLVVACVFLGAVDAGVDEGDVAWYKTTPRQTLDGFANPMAGGSIHGSEFGFKIVTLDMYNRGLSAPDFCVLARQAFTVRCYKWDDTAKNYPAAPDFEWKTTDCTSSGTIANDAGSVNHRYYALTGMAAGYFSDTSNAYPDLAIIGDWYERCEDGYGRAYVFVFVGSSGGFGVDGNNCPNGGVLNLKADSGDLDGVRGGAFSLMFTHADASQAGADTELYVGQMTETDDHDSGWFSQFRESQMSSKSFGAGVVNPFKGVDYYLPTAADQTGTANMYFGSSMGSGFFSGQATGIADLFVTAQRGTIRNTDTQRANAGLPAIWAQGMVFGYHGMTTSRTNFFMYARGAHSNELFGFSLMGEADVDGDGITDLLIGAPFYSMRIPGLGAALYGESGRVVIIWGDTRYQTTQYSSTWASDSAWVNYTDPTIGQVLYCPHPQSGGRFGWSLLSLGDVNNDQFGDFAVGSPGYDGFRGRVYVFRGRSRAAGGVDSSPYWYHTGPAGTTELFGFSLGVGDFDEDTVPDMLISGYGEWDTTGHVYIYEAVENTDFRMNITSPQEGSTLLAGASATTQIYVWNRGPRAAATMNVTVTHVADVKYDSLTVDAKSAAVSIACSDVSTETGAKTVCSFSGGMAVDEFAWFTLSWNTSLEIPSGTHSFDAAVEFEYVDLSPSFCSLSISWESRADIEAVSLIQSNSTIYAGKQNLYTITFRNNGPTAALGVQFYSMFSPSTTGVAWASHVFPGGSCSYHAVSKEIYCEVSGAMAPQASMSVSVLTSVSPSFGLDTGSFSMKAQFVGAETYDPNPLNNALNISTTIDHLCDFRLEFLSFAPAAGVNTGEILKLYSTTKQVGPSSCKNVDLWFDVPFGSTIVSLTCPYQTISGHFNETLSTNTTRLHVLIADFKPSTTQTPLVTAEIRMAQDYGSDTAVIYANATTTTPETSTTNQHANVTVTVKKKADLYVSIGGGDLYESIRPGNDISMQVTVGNAGPGAIRLIEMKFQYPENCTLVQYPSSTAEWTVSLNVSERMVIGVYSSFLDAANELPASLTTFVIRFDEDIFINDTVSYYMKARAWVNSDYVVDEQPSDNFYLYSKKLSAMDCDLSVLAFGLFHATNHTLGIAPTNGSSMWYDGVFPTWWEPGVTETSSNVAPERGVPTLLRVWIQNTGHNVAQNVSLYTGMRMPFRIVSLENSGCEVLRYPNDEDWTYPLEPMNPGLSGIPAGLGSLSSAKEHLFNKTSGLYTILRCDIGDVVPNANSVPFDLFTFFAYLDSNSTWEVIDMAVISGAWANSPEEVAAYDNIDVAVMFYQYSPYIAPEEPPAPPEVEPAKLSGGQVATAIGSMLLAALLAAPFVFSLIVCIIGCLFTTAIVLTIARKVRQSMLKQKRRARYERISKLRTAVAGDGDDLDSFDSGEEDDEDEESSEEDSEDSEDDFDE